MQATDYTASVPAAKTVKFDRFEYNTDLSGVVKALSKEKKSVSFDRFEYKNLGQAYKNGYNTFTGWIDKLKSFKDGLSGFDKGKFSDLTKGLGDLSKIGSLPSAEKSKGSADKGKGSAGGGKGSSGGGKGSAGTGKGSSGSANKGKNTGVGDKSGSAGKISDIAKNTGSTATNTAQTADLLDATDEMIKLLKEMSTKAAINDVTSVEIRVDMTNYNSINSELDIDGVVGVLETKLTEKLQTAADGVHY